MLQIATGRFFADGPMWEHNGVGILHSNFSWVREIETSAGTLEPADAMGAAPTSWVVRYVNRMERVDGPGALIRTGDAELVEQFQLLCSLGLRAFFHVDRDVVVHTCRTRPLGRHDHSPPSLFVTRVLNPEVRGTAQETEAFVQFVDDCIRLPRKHYKVLISAARATYDSLVVASHNLHLAYSMLVYALESLTQEFDAFTPAWENFDQTARHALDEILETLPGRKASDVRNVLVQTSHTKLMARFVHFVSSNVRDSFYQDECPKGLSSLRASDLVRALQTAYATRSGFVHKLEPIRHQISIPQIADGEVFDWERTPYLTYRGLLRLVQHVLHSFVTQTPKLDSEDINWRSDLPGVVIMRAAPQYWIWNATNFKPSSGSKVLGGLIAHLDDVKTSKGAITDMRKVVEECFSVFPQAKVPERPALLCIVVLFNAHVVQENQVEGWSKFVEDHSDVLDQCCIERILLDLQLGRSWFGTPDEIVACVAQYMQRRHHRNSVELPRKQLTALLLGAYNVMLESGNAVEAHRWGQRALLDEGGNPDLQALIRANIEKSAHFDLAQVLWGDATQTQRESPSTQDVDD